MDEIHRKRLEWMAKAKFGDDPPDGLFMPANSWAEAVSSTAQAALDEIDRKPRPAFPADPEAKSLLEAHYKDALRLLAEAGAEIARLRKREDDLEAEIESERLSQDYN